MHQLSKIITSIKNINSIVIIVFSLLLCTGLNTVLDYGVSADEATQRTIGQNSLNYVKQVLPLPFLNKPTETIDKPRDTLNSTER